MEKEKPYCMRLSKWKRRVFFRLKLANWQNGLSFTWRVLLLWGTLCWLAHGKKPYISMRTTFAYTLSSRSMYGRTNVAIVAVWCALFSDRKCCFGVDCFRMEVAVAIQMCCEHDTQTIRFRLDWIVKILYNIKIQVNCLFWTGQTFHLQNLKTEIGNCTKLQVFGFIRAH